MSDERTDIEWIKANLSEMKADIKILNTKMTEIEARRATGVDIFSRIVSAAALIMTAILIYEKFAG